MRRLFLLLAALLRLALHAQPAASQAYVQALVSFNEQYARSDEAAQQGDSSRTEAEYLQAIALYKAQPDSVRTFVQDQQGDPLGGLCYNLTCVQSLQGKSSSPESLTEAVDRDYIRNDYTAYDWMLSDPDLQRVRAHFRLDSVAGSGDELSRILNLMHWAHRIVRHDGGSMNPSSRTPSTWSNSAAARGADSIAG